MNDFDNYLKGLLGLQDYISRSVLVNSFFDILEGDQEFLDQYAIPSTRISPQRDPPIMSFLNNNNNDRAALQQAQAQAQAQMQRRNTRTSQYQQDRLSQYENIRTNSLTSRISGLSLQQQFQQQQQPQSQRVSAVSTDDSSAQKTVQNSDDSGTKHKLKFYYKDDIFAIVVSESITVFELKNLIVPRVDEAQEPDVLDRIKIIPKDVNNVDQFEYMEEDIIVSDTQLWKSKNFTDKGKFLVVV
ncbi:unnamed protein product [Ambrosiozyma monospora]|uniref:Unnamed protein product n=1 Tax=Ambrosiozyma monospora TaxID=43982 RepID=A0A9W6YSL0_AMBMO|nr:unnamed protein product [Ambrosiozyma monospora]